MTRHFIYILILTVAIFQLSAQNDSNLNKYGKFHEPDSNEVILVGKVNVKSKLNMDFIEKSRRLTKEDLNRSDLYTAPEFYNPGEIEIIVNMMWFSFDLNISGQDTFKDGEYFYMTYQIPKNRYMELDKIFYYVCANKKLCTVLPIPINFYVPEGIKALYLGDFSYVVEGDDFSASEPVITYSMDQAQEALDKATNKHYELVKADWKHNRKSKILEYTKLSGTPDDSVVFYGGFCRNNKYAYYCYNYIFERKGAEQSELDQESKKTRFFVSEPVKPGSTYVLRYWKYLLGEAYKFDEDTSILAVDIPQEPGLYYFGFYDADNSIEKQQPVKLDSNSNALKKEALEAVLECYKGTEWEDYIRKELEKN